MHRALAVAALVVLGGVGGATALSTTATHANEPPRTGVAGPPPGLSHDGVTDPLALADAHDRALRNASFAISTTFTYRRPNGTLLGHGTASSRVAPGGASFYTVRSQANRNATRPLGVAHYETEVWSDGNRTLTARHLPGGSVTYRDRSDIASSLRPDTEWEAMYAAFSTVNTTVVSRFERNGTTLYKVVSTSGPDPDSAYADDEAYDVTALVGADGVVRTFELTRRTTFDGGPAILTRTVQVSDVGDTAVERPTWYQRAVENETVDGS